MQLSRTTLTDHEGNDFVLSFDKRTVIAMLRYYG